MSAPTNDLSTQIRNDKLSSLMFRLAIPGILGMGVASINTFLDAIFVGQFVGENAVAAISLAFPILMLIGGITSMIAQGSASVLSRAIGAEDDKRQRAIFSNLTALSLVLGIGLSIPGYFLAAELIGMLGGKGDIQELGKSYLQIMMIGATPRIFAIGINVLIRAEGNLKAAMTFSAGAAILNIGLNALFVGLWGWGIEGAAWASVISMVAMVAMDYSHFLRGKNSFPVNLKKIFFSGLIVKEVLFIGISAMMLQVMFFLQQVAVFRSVAKYGTDWDLAFMGACYRIYILAIIPIFGFAQALAPVIGINFGAKQPERVRKAMWLFSATATGIICVMWLGLAIFSEATLSALLPNSTFSDHHIFLFRITLLILPFQPFFFTGVTLFQSIGNGRTAAILLVSRMFLIFIPAVLLLPLAFGLDGVYYAHPLADFLSVGIMFVVVWRALKK